MARRLRLAIVGASVRAAAQSAMRAGFEVVGADLFADADLDGVCPITRIEDYPEGLADWLAEQDVDAWMYTGALENYPDLVDRMAKLAPLWGVSGQALRRCRDPWECGHALYREDIAVAPVLPVRSARGWPFAFGGWEATLGKTYRHSGGAGTWRVTTREDFDRVVAEAGYLQPVIEPSVGYAAAFAIGEAGATLLGVTWQLLGTPASEFGYSGSVGPVALSSSQQEQVAAIGRGLANRMGLRGLIGVDLVEFEKQLVLIEINPRFTASVEVLERASGRSAIGALRDACEGKPIEPWEPAVGRCVAKRILFARRDATIAKRFTELPMADRPRVGEVIAKDHPICTLIVEADSEAAVRERLREAISEAERLLYADCEPE